MREDLAPLVEALIEGLVEEPLWSTFVHRLQQRLHADYVGLVFRPLPFGTPEARVVHIYAGQPSPPDVSQYYRDSLYKADPMPYHDLLDGRVYGLDELLHAGEPTHEFYRDALLTASGMNVLLMMRVVETSGVSAWLSVSRRDGAFTGEDEALVAQLGPYLRAALRSHVAFERERITASVAHETVRRMNFGWLTLDAHGCVLDADASGASLLVASNMLVKDRGGRLTAREPEIAREIAEGIATLAADSRGRPRAIVLSRDPWFDMLLVPSSVRSGTTGPAPALVAYVHADGWSAADRCDQLGELFDLMPSEARLALALSRGMSIAEAAVELGLTVESARTYSKRIYAKTGARGQADLVRFVHRSVLAIA